MPPRGECEALVAPSKEITPRRMRPTEEDQNSNTLVPGTMAYA